MVCCKWSCIMCRAFVTRSSEICSDMDGAMAEELSHPFQAPFHHWKRCCASWSPEKSRRVQVQGHLTLRMVWRKKSGRQIVVDQG